MADDIKEFEAIEAIVAEEAAEVTPDYIDSPAGIRVLGSAMGSRIAALLERSVATRIGTQEMGRRLTVFLADLFRSRPDDGNVCGVARQAMMFVQEKHGIEGMSMST